ncbi:hypothetical protein, partial [Streptomyces caniscabiei]|uniref:hypothetical protein n=1 Tax=Streptomyces caniscabiei TaxID=2746961 RepID=UPI0038F7553B
PQRPIVILSRHLPDGDLSLVVDPNGALRARIASRDGDARTVESCPLRQSEPAKAMLCLWWDADDVELSINGIMIASQCRAADIPVELPLPSPI